MSCYIDYSVVDEDRIQNVLIPKLMDEKLPAKSHPLLGSVKNFTTSYEDSHQMIEKVKSDFFSINYDEWEKISDWIGHYFFQESEENSDLDIYQEHGFIEVYSSSCKDNLIEVGFDAIILSESRKSYLDDHFKYENEDFLLCLEVLIFMCAKLDLETNSFEYKNDLQRIEEIATHYLANNKNPVYWDRLERLSYWGVYLNDQKKLLTQYGSKVLRDINQ